MLEVRALTKRYSGTPAVDNVSFTALPGEVTGYLGPNGSGKSTTVKIITGLLDPTAGEILYRGRPIRDNLVEFKRILGYVPEEPYLYPHLTGAEYLELAGELRDLPAATLPGKIGALLELFSLASPALHSELRSLEQFPTPAPAAGGERCLFFFPDETWRAAICDIVCQVAAYTLATNKEVARADPIPVDPDTICGGHFRSEERRVGKEC